MTADDVADLNARSDATGAADGPGSLRPRVLIVDDDPVIRTVTGRLLARSEYEGIETSGGEESIEAFRSLLPEICCVLLDVSLSGMTSTELLARFREIDELVPVVVVSGFLAADVKEQLRDQRIEGVVHKPFGSSQLVAAIEEARRGTSSASSWG